MVEVPFTEIIAEADSVVIGSIDSVESRWNDDRTLIQTFATVSVEQNVAKAPVGSTITLVIDGGTVDGITLWVDDTPVLLPGEQIGVALRSQDSGLYAPYGLSQGIWTLADAPEDPDMAIQSAGGLSAEQFIEAVRMAEEGIDPCFKSEVAAPIGDAEFSLGALSPATASAGTHETVTINGSGFGTKASMTSMADVSFFFIREGNPSQITQSLPPDICRTRTTRPSTTMGYSTGPTRKLSRGCRQVLPGEAVTTMVQQAADLSMFAPTPLR
jgi:hypothetical protein